jgi:hypothetical protein
MKPERWQQIKDLPDKALPLDERGRASLLDQACSGDPSLRKEVEPFISADRDVHASFLRTSPIASLGLASGARLGDYQIETLLESGGMGEVCRAHDIRIRLAVAIKVLPAFLPRSPRSGCAASNRRCATAALIRKRASCWSVDWSTRAARHGAFYAALSSPVRVGIEASGHTRWFERMLAELGQKRVVRGPLGRGLALRCPHSLEPRDERPSPASHCSR